MADDRPRHVVDASGDRRTRCGLRVVNSDEGLPYVLARHVPMHVAGRGMLVCPGCEIPPAPTET